MNFDIQLTCDGIEWDKVSNLIKRAGLSVHPPEQTQKAFKNSYATVFVFDNHNLIGTGRAISDGVYQSAIYDIAVLPEYQKRGVGTVIIKELLQKLSSTNIIFYANPSAAGFYDKLGFRKLLTGGAKFIDEERMRLKRHVD